MTSFWITALDIIAASTPWALTVFATYRAATWKRRLKVFASPEFRTFAKRHALDELRADNAMCLTGAGWIRLFNRLVPDSDLSKLLLDFSADEAADKLLLHDGIRACLFGSIRDLCGFNSVTVKASSDFAVAAVSFASVEDHVAFRLRFADELEGLD